MKPWSWMVGFACIALSLCTHAFSEEPVHIASGEWPPYISKHLAHQGIASRIVSEAFALGHIKVHYGYFPWSRSYEFAKTGEWDGTLLWFDTPERRKLFYISEPVIDIQYVFFYLSDRQFDWDTMDDLAGLKVGGTLKYNYGEAFKQAEESGKITVERVASDAQNLQKLIQGRIDVFANEIASGYAMIHQHLAPAQVKRITHHPKPVRAAPHHVLLSRKVKRNKALIKIFNAGLNQLKVSGKLDQYIADVRK